MWCRPGDHYALWEAFQIKYYADIFGCTVGAFPIKYLSIPYIIISSKEKISKHLLIRLLR
jgi:hypothetical protein